MANRATVKSNIDTLNVPSVTNSVMGEMLKDNLADNLVFLEDEVGILNPSSQNFTVDFTGNDRINVTKTGSPLNITCAGLGDGNVKYMLITKSAGQVITFVNATDVTPKQDMTDDMTTVLYRVTKKGTTIWTEAVALTIGRNQTIPLGAIIMWSGSVLAIPENWHLCDGTEGTPPLQGMFIAGYDPSDPDYNSIGKQGGEKEHTLTESELAAHHHSLAEGDGATINITASGGHTHSYQYCDEFGSDPGLEDSKGSNSSQQTGSSTHTHPASSFAGNTANAGGNVAHENRPPYYTLAFIMKIT